MMMGWPDASLCGWSAVAEQSLDVGMDASDVGHVKIR